MDVIGNNIANVNTAGYKTARTTFQDIFSQNVSAGMGNQGQVGGTNPMQIGLGIRLSTVDVLHTRSAFQRTDRETDMMINGDGFFIVAAPDGGYFYTRAGNFDIDNEGYLVNSMGYYVMGVTNELKMGVIDVGSAPEIDWDGTGTAPPGYRAPVLGIVAEPEARNPDRDGLEFTQGLDRIRLIAYPSANTEPIDPEELSILANLQIDLNEARKALAEARLTGVGADIAAALQDFQDAVIALDQWIEDNGYANDTDNPRPLTGFAVGKDGSISVMIDNRKVVIAEVQLAMFSNPSGLEKGGNSLYRETASSGEAVISRPIVENGAGSVDGGGLEMSNVDLSNEFTDMIVTQRGFQANSRIITVSDTMLEELVNLKR